MTGDAVQRGTPGWTRGAMAAGPLLLALIPVLAGRLDPVLLAVFVQLPIYALHQIEEHVRDRFRRFVNARLAGGTEALTPAAVAFINIVLVWVLDLGALYLAAFVSPALGLIAVWLALVNTAVHVAAAVAMRAYNPGLVTAVVLLLPGGLYALRVMAAAGAAPAWGHAVGIGVAVLGHLWIVVHVKGRAGRLAGPVAGPA